MARTRFNLSVLAFSMTMALVSQAQAQSALKGQSEAAVRLAAATGSAAEVKLNNATGAARFVKLAPAGKQLIAQSQARAGTDDAKQGRANEFLRDYGALFGISNAATELSAAKMTKDRQGGARLAHKQLYQGLPVFGGELKAHFTPAGELSVVNGTFVPDINVDTKPTRSAEQASATAIARVQSDIGRPGAALKAQASLMIYRTGLAQGIQGTNHLAWQVEVGNRNDVRDFVYVDAHTGKIIDKINGIHEAKNRRAFDAGGATAPGPNYPGTPFWVEGQAFPTGTVEADNMISASSEIYDLFKNAFGRDSFDGAGATMDSIFNRGNGCPNASWNGVFISFCPGTTTDDITAHEWGHAYTEYTDNLIYAWQPGALNESYSDIWGETVDRLNGRGGDTPDAVRTPGACTTSTPAPASVTVLAPASIAGAKGAGLASFGPTSFSLTGDVVLANDGTGTSNSDACSPLVNAAAIAGKIALIDRGTCGFAIKTKNAQNAGAVGVIIGNNASGTAPGLGGADATITIPTLSVSQGDATAMKVELAGATTVTANLSRGGTGSDASVRWLMGEDSTGFGGAIRDMYNPVCYGHPGKVSDAQYTCNFDPDNGGVHSNSGVPNHAYALLVDGGAYNGQNITAIGLTKAAHIYYRAQSVYQGPTSNFVDHADAIEQSCADLTGANLAHLKTGAPSGEVINASDCAQVAKAALAVELRTPPAQCNFAPVLAKTPPPLCPSGSPTSLMADNFDGSKRGGVRWTTTNVGSKPEFTVRNFGVVNGMPGGRAGYGAYVPDFQGGTCAAGGDQTGVMRLDSPEVTIPAGTTTLRFSFDHWMASEAGWDGGNLKISVNGGAWQLVAAGDFVYNPYNAALITAGNGNTNPMAGQAAFSGTDGGSVSGSWGRSIVNLAPYAAPNDKVKLRFEFGNDGCGGSFGWFLDDVNLYRCTAAPL